MSSSKRGSGAVGVQPSSRDVGGRAPEGLAAFDLASILLVALATGLDVGLGDERFATAARPHPFPSVVDELAEDEEPEEVRGRN